ncbi:MAG: hypothetical protein OIF32_11475 [Campylobacterales bacterium]|nr:hypothetical protein [Campylobacterales bacterium]
MKKVIFFALLLPVFLKGELLVPFKTNYNDKIYGDVVTIGGILQTPKNHRAKNNDQAFMYDFDDDNNWYTKNSSKAELMYPDESFIRIAKLYWWGRATEDTKGINTIKFKTPTTNEYKELTSDKTITKNRRYISMKDVTTEVILGKEGEYFIADLITEKGFHSYGGWVLVMVYENEMGRRQEITIQDGYFHVTKRDNLSIELDPKEMLTKAVDFTLFTIDGDREDKGDNLIVNGKKAWDEYNNIDDYFNGFNGKRNLSYDKDHFQGDLINKKVDIEFTTKKDIYHPFLLISKQKLKPFRENFLIPYYGANYSFFTSNWSINPAPRKEPTASATLSYGVKLGHERRKWRAFVDLSQSNWSNGSLQTYAFGGDYIFYKYNHLKRLLGPFAKYTNRHLRPYFGGSIGKSTFQTNLVQEEDTSEGMTWEIHGGTYFKIGFVKFEANLKYVHIDLTVKESGISDNNIPFKHEVTFKNSISTTLGVSF